MYDQTNPAVASSPTKAHAVREVTARPTGGGPQSHARFDGSIPELYDSCLGPVLFRFAAVDLAKRLAQELKSGSNVLEIASGTGIATEQLWRILPPDVRITASDLNQAMLDLARDKRGRMTGVDYLQADVSELPFDNEQFDAVACQFGIMFFPDKPRAVSEMARVLKPGGTLIFNVWDSLSENPAVKLTHDTISSFVSGAPPTFLETPFGYHHCRTIKDLLLGANLADVQISVVPEVVQGADPYSLARGLVCGNPGVVEIRERASKEPEEIVQFVGDVLTEAFGANPSRIPFQEIVFSAKKKAA